VCCLHVALLFFKIETIAENYVELRKRKLLKGRKVNGPILRAVKIFNRITDRMMFKLQLITARITPRFLLITNVNEDELKKNNERKKRKMYYHSLLDLDSKSL
jgi:hypothetical protein